MNRVGFSSTRGPEVGGVVDARRKWTRPVFVVVLVTPRHINPDCGSRNRGMVVVAAIVLVVMPRLENLASREVFDSP